MNKGKNEAFQLKYKKKSLTQLMEEKEMRFSSNTITQQKRAKELLYQPIYIEGKSEESICGILFINKPMPKERECNSRNKETL